MLRWLFPNRLNEKQMAVLRALTEGWTLKSHRELDGSKIFRLHPLDGEPQTVDGSTVAELERRGLIGTNHKFPVATFLLTEQGMRFGDDSLPTPVQWESPGWGR